MSVKLNINNVDFSKKDGTKVSLNTVVDKSATEAIKEIEKKGNEVLQSIPEDFTTQMASKLDKQQGAENKGKALVVGEDGNVTVGEVQGGDGIPIINTASGESPLVVSDSAERVNKGFSLIGKSEQVTTTGVNLIPFPYTDKDMSKNGVTFEVQQDGGVNIYGTATESVDFFLSMLDYGNDSIFNNGKGNGKVLSGGKNGVEIEYHGTNKRLYLTIAKGKTVNTVIYPQLQNGSTSTPYEPYTGGKPSPSPEYPQEIKNVGKWNPETQKYEVDVKVKGKNLFNKNAAKQGYEFGSAVSDGESTNQKWFVSDFMPVKATTYQISGKKTGAGCKLYNKDKAFVKNIQCPFGGIKFDEGIAYFRINGEIKDLDKIQVEEGGTPTLYEPYKEQTIKLSLDQPLRGIGKYKDEVTKDGIIRRIKQIVLNGSEEWILNNNTSKEKTQSFGIKVDAGCMGVNIGGICNRFLPKYTVWIGDNEGFDIYAMHTLYINIEKTKASSVGEFKKWLSKNQIIIEAILEKTITEPLPEDFKQAIESLKTYYPTTVITVDGGEANPDIEVSYIADTKNYIDQKIASVVKTVVETQKALL